MMQIELISRILPFCGMILLSGCANVGLTIIEPVHPDPTLPLDKHEIGVVEETALFKIRHYESKDLDALERARIQVFVDRYRQQGHGMLTISMPDVANSSQRTIFRHIQDLAYMRGVNFEDMNYKNYPTMGEIDRSIILSFTYYKVIMPDCPSLSTIDIAETWENRELASFGCATTSNLAAMIAYPGDLFGNREVDPVDIDQRLETLRKYRTGRATASETDESSDGSISQVIQ